MNAHENLVNQSEIVGGSDRNFGLVFTVVFLLIGVYPLLDEKPVLYVPLGISALFFATALIKPGSLGILNRIWSKFGLLMSVVMNPIILGFIFLVILTPIALAMKVAGKDPLRLKLELNSDSYWIKRTPPGPEPKSMKHQF